MAYFGLALILGFMYFIEWLEKKGCEKQNRRIEEIHKRAYAWADENLPTPVHAREFKAQIDTMAHSICESKGRAYNPPTLQEVTTVAERKKRLSTEKRGKQYTSDDVLAYVLQQMTAEN